MLNNGQMDRYPIIDFILQTKENDCQKLYCTQYETNGNVTQQLEVWVDSKLPADGSYCGQGKVNFNLQVSAEEYQEI